MIEAGDVYYVAFPRWPGTFDENLPAPEHWHATTVWRMLDGVDFWGRPNVERVDKIPLGSRALVIKNPGEGEHVKGMCEMYNQDDPTVFMECLITNIETLETFTAVVGCSELWPHDPRTETLKHEGK